MKSIKIVKGNDQEIEFQKIEIGIFEDMESFHKILHHCLGDRIGPRGRRGSLFQDFFSNLT